MWPHYICALRVSCIKFRKVQVFGTSALCTFKLHQFAVHLVDQAKAQGATAYTMEMWVERMVGLMKTMVKYRSSECPELLFVNDWLLRVAMATWRQLRPDVCKTFDEHVPAYRSKAPSELTHDICRDKFGLQLIGAGTPLKGSEAELVRDKLEVVLRQDYWYRDQQQGAGWPVESSTAGALSNDAKLTKYVRAVLASDDCMHSSSVVTQRKKDNCWALISYTEEQADGSTQDVLYVARMKFFVVAVCPVVRADGSISCPLKLGVGDLYKAQVIEGPGTNTTFDRERGLVPDLIMCQLNGTGAWAPKATNMNCLINLAELSTQVVPTREFNVSNNVGRLTAYRYLMTANKASGRLYRSG